MISTKEQPSHFDGLERAEPNEPVFPLRAHDRHAAGLVHEWVRLRREWIANADLPEAKRKLELIQVSEAEEIAWAMQDWRDGQPAEEEAAAAPALPASYLGNTLDAAELRAKEEFDAIKNASRVIHNAVAELTDILPVLFKGAGGTVMADRYSRFEAALNNIKGMGESITPKRASYTHKAE